MQLAYITSAAENAALLSLTSGTTWIGGNDHATEGQWVWVDGSPMTYTAWNSGEPNDSGGEDCAQLWSLGKWNDGSCAEARAYACRGFSPPAPPAPPPLSPAPPAIPRPSTYERTILTVLLKFDGYTDPWDACDEECVAAANERLAATMLSESYAQETFNTDASHTIRMEADSVTCDIGRMFNMLEGQAGALGVDISAYVHVEFLIHISLLCGYGGVAYVGGKASATLLYGNWEWIRLHELGHNYGLLHGWKDNIEYADHSCIMGNGDIYSGAVRLIRGWVPSVAITHFDALEGVHDVVIRTLSSDPYLPGSGEQMTLLTAPDLEWGGGWKLVVWLDPVHQVVTIHKAASLFASTHFWVALGVGDIFEQAPFELKVVAIDVVAGTASLHLVPKKIE